MAYLVGIDVGGTFTDVLAFDTDTGDLASAKVSSIPDRQWEGLLDALTAIRIDPRAISGFVHGTTIATNALLERRIGKVALVTTRGFRDVIEVGRTRRLDGGLFDLGYRRPAPLVPRELRLEIDERMSSEGEILRPLPDEDVEAVAGRSRDAGVDAVAICFLNSPVNDANEREAARRIGEALGSGIAISSSADIVREIGEFERFTTTVANAALMPIVGRYIASLSAALASRGLDVPVNVMSSNGGAMGLAVARRLPVRTFLSGPVGGVIGALQVTRAAGIRNFITFDMGGTSTDVALVENELPRITFSNRLGAVPLKVPQLDIHTIGAGGGSVVRREIDGTIDVGPQSAGAVPGPACYDRGGTLPTVSDANLLLGRLSADRPLAGGLRLSRERSVAAFRALAPEADDGALLDLANGVLGLVVMKMAGAVREITVHRGLDPQDFSLLGFGGAGPMHVLAVADELLIDRVLIPRYPGHLSALGQLMADTRHDAVLPWSCRLAAFRPKEFRAAVDDLRARVDALFEADGTDWREAEISVSADIRYVGQSFTLIVPVDVDEPDPDRMRADFDRQHGDTFGYADRLNDAETTALRLVARVPVAKPPLRFEPEPGEALIEDAIVAWSEGPRSTPFLRRSRLPSGSVVHGPAILEEEGGTTVVPPGWTAEVDPQGNLACLRHNERSATP